MRVVMMGTGRFAEPTFAALLDDARVVVAGLVTNPDRPSGRDRTMERGIKHLAAARGVPVFQPEKINTPDGVQGVRQFAPDVLVVAAYGQILSREVLSVAPRGGINVHASLLPKYRGAAPIAWAIYHGETCTGVTIIRMSVQLDAGDMLAQEALEIGPDETAGELEARLAPLGARLALAVLERMAQGPVPGVRQDPSLVTKAPKLTKENGLLDWSRPASSVRDQVRAMQPWPTAYTFWHEPEREPLRVILWRAQVGPSAANELPGTPLPDAEGHLLVAARAGTSVELVEVQPAGKRRMTGGEFLRGHPPGPHCRFGSLT